MIILFHVLNRMIEVIILIVFCLSFFSCGPSNSGEMVSRRKILSRSRDDLNLDQNPEIEEEDVWYQKEKLFKVNNMKVLVLYILHAFINKRRI